MFYMLLYAGLVRSETQWAAMDLIGHLVGGRWLPDPGQRRLRMARSTRLAVPSIPASRVRAVASAPAASVSSSSSSSTTSSLVSSSNDDAVYEQQLRDLGELFASVAPLAVRVPESSARLRRLLLGELAVLQQQQHDAAESAKQVAAHALTPSAFDPLTSLRPPARTSDNANTFVSPATKPSRRKPAASAGSSSKRGKK